MPPSLQCSSSTLTCARQLCKASSSPRSFSTTPRSQQRTTRARRALYRWLGTVGENFRNPLPGSTNYLGAYNSFGKLKRVVAAEAENRNSKTGQPSGDGDGGASTALPPETQRDRTPFPLSRTFVSQSVLSEEFRDEIWFRIMKQGKSVREVSANMGVEMSRVGAVVRLKEVELEWKRIGKPLATPYAKAVMSMLPKTGYVEDDREAGSTSEQSVFQRAHTKPKRLMNDAERKKLREENKEKRAQESSGLENRKFARHETINDLPVHAKTGQQIFHPTSESRQFTRADAAKVFDERLLPADDRIPHPELVLQHREYIEGKTVEERTELAELRAEKAERKRQHEAERQAARDAQIKRVETPRWEFRFTEANVEEAGKTGRGHNGVGWRYGVPLYDRNRGLVKIPQSVE